MDEEILNQVSKLILKALSFTDKKNCWLSIDILNLLTLFNIRKRNHIDITLERIFIELINYGENFENLLISSFTNDFITKRYFNVSSSKPYVNSFSKFIFNKKYLNRTLHPFFSFYNFGFKKDNKDLNKYTDSFGNNSIFNFIIENDFELITLGHHYVQSFTIVHHLEHIIGVPYREELSFEGKLSNDTFNTEGSYNYFLRKSDICEGSGLTFNALKKLENFKIVKLNCLEFFKKNIYSYCVNFKDSADFIIKNHSKNCILVDSYHSKINPNKEFVSTSDSISLYEKLLKNI